MIALLAGVGIGVPVGAIVTLVIFGQWHNGQLVKWSDGQDDLSPQQKAAVEHAVVTHREAMRAQMLGTNRPPDLPGARRVSAPPASPRARRLHSVGDDDAT